MHKARQPLMKALSLSILALVWVAASPPAQAGGFAASRFGGEFGHPTTDHPSAIYFNPAGLALSTGTGLYLEGLFIYRGANYTRDSGAIDNIVPDGEVATGTPEDAVSANAGEATLANMLAAPFVAVTSDLGVKNLGVGLALYAPFGGSASWDQNSAYEGNEQYPGAVDGPARWATIEGTIQALYVSLGGAYRIPAARLSLGLSINGVRQVVDTVRARNTSGTDHLTSSTGTVVEGRSLVEVSGTTLSIGAGVIWEANDKLRVGASYQSQPGFGENTLKGDLTNQYGTGSVEPGPIDFLQSLPDVIRLGASLRVNPKVELRLSGDYTRWSVFDRQCLLDANQPDRNCDITDSGAVGPDAVGVIVVLPRDWKDTYGFKAGGSYFHTPNLELFGGASYDSSAVPDKTLDPALMDMPKLVASLGARMKLLGEKMTVIASYTHVYYFSRTTDPRLRDSNGDVIAPSPPSLNPDSAGTYKQFIGMLTVGLGYTF